MSALGADLSLQRSGKVPLHVPPRGKDSHNSGIFLPYNASKTLCCNRFSDVQAVAITLHIPDVHPSRNP